MQSEKLLQAEIAVALLEGLPDDGWRLMREERLDKDNIIDFLIDDIGIEVKIKGGKREIFRQCTRYCEFERVKTLILVTNISMGFPPTINGKDCYLFKLGQAWL